LGGLAGCRFAPRRRHRRLVPLATPGRLTIRRCSVPVLLPWKGTVPKPGAERSAAPGKPRPSICRLKAGDIRGVGCPAGDPSPGLNRFGGPVSRWQTFRLPALWSELPEALPQALELRPFRPREEMGTDGDRSSTGGSRPAHTAIRATRGPPRRGDGQLTYDSGCGSPVRQSAWRRSDSVQWRSSSQVAGRRRRGGPPRAMAMSCSHWPAVCSSAKVSSQPPSRR